MLIYNMDTATNLNMVKDSNILVREEDSAISQASLMEIPGFIKPGISTILKSSIRLCHDQVL